LGGGDKMYFLAETTKTIDINYKMRDVLIDYFKKNDTIKLSTDNRFIRIQ
jgi:5'-nucleotidase